MTTRVEQIPVAHDQAPWISLAIPFYRGHLYLAAAIKSALGQSNPDLELLVCDDGVEDEQATQETERLVASFDDPRLRYLRNSRRLGMASNWNRCFSAAKSSRVTLLHQDDQLLPDYVATIQKLWQAKPEASAWFCKARIIDDVGRPRLSVPDLVKEAFVPRRDQEIRLEGERGVARLMAGYFIFTPTLCWNRTVVGDAPFDPQWQQVQDLDCVIRSLERGGTLLGSRSVGYAYRRHSENATAQQAASFLRFEEEYRVFDRIAERCARLGWPRAEKVARRKTIVKLHLLYRSGLDLLSGRLRLALRNLAFLARGGPR